MFLFFILALYISWIDLRTMTVPLIPVIAGTLTAFLINPFPLAFAGALIGAALMSMIRYTATRICEQEAVGEGDIWWMACSGAFTGWQGVLFTVAAGSWLGCLCALTLWLCGKNIRRMHVPFVPFLAAGAVIYIVWGETLLRRLF